MTETALVHEAVGPSLRPGPAAAALAQGVLGLNILGVAPVLLGALFDAGRLSAAGIGETAMVELLSMGLSTGLAGALLPPRRLRTLGVVAAGLLALLDAACIGAKSPALLLLRGLAGLPEGVLIWISVGMIARTATPERWAAVFFTAQTLAQLVLAVLFWSLVLPRFGADGGLAALGLTSLLGIPTAFIGPSRYGPLLTGAEGSGAPPPRGWLALFAAFVFVAGNGAVTVYLQPLASQAGLPAAVPRLANVASLVFQVIGGTLATLLAGRISWLKVFIGCAVGYLAVWTAYGFQIPAVLFVAATALAGLISLLVGPFLTPMTIEADPTRRTAMQAAGAQIFGAAAGPLGASFLVSDRDVRGVLPFAGALVVFGLALMTPLRVRRPRRG